MKRLLLVGLVSAVCLGLPSVAGAKTVKPMSVLEEYCVNDQGVQNYYVRFGVTGFPPDVQVTDSLHNSGGLGIAFTFTTDENGDFIYVVGSLPGDTWTSTVDSPYLGGTVTKTVTVTCEPKPTSIEQCMNGGYVGFSFKNQGECVAFVQRGPGPDPRSE